MPDEWRRYERVAADACLRAAELIRKNSGHPVGVGVKSSPTDVVTQTDVDAEALIRSTLLAATPEAGVIGEEGGQAAPAATLQWIVDPLDGTVNFTYHIPIVAVAVAAAYHGALVAGAVVDVARNELFCASLGGGATLNGSPINPSECARLEAAMVTTGFSYSAGLRREHGAVVAELLPRVRDIRCFGSAALELCWVACGRVDVYYERDIKLWDYAAASLIAREAGATVELPCPENHNSIVAATPTVFDQLRGTVLALTGSLLRGAPHGE